jgi:3',5'-cyclic AMP phosphodiesterase CpdA
MFTLAHLSDPHLGPIPDARLRELANKRVFGYLNWRHNRAGRMSGTPLQALMRDIAAVGPDHIAVTGDIVNLGLKAEIGPAAVWLESLGSPARVSAVPGNHDAYVPGSLDRATRHWSAFMVGDDIDHSPHIAPVFPYVRKRGKVAIVGTSSAKATGPFMATGHFEPTQALRLTQTLEALGHQGYFRVVLIHHPPLRSATGWHKRLVGGAHFRAAIAASGAELVLHGHTHDATIMSVAGPGSEVVPVVCVPSASASVNSRHPPARYNLFEIGGEPGDWRCRMIERGLPDRGGEVKELSRRILHGPGAMDYGMGGWVGPASNAMSPERRGSAPISMARANTANPNDR